MKKYIYSICFSSVLAAFTLFVVLDTFVISRPMEYVHEQINTSMFSSSRSSSTEDNMTKDTDSSGSADDMVTTDKRTSHSADTEAVSEEEKNDESIASESYSEAELIGEYQNDQASIKLYKYYLNP